LKDLYTFIKSKGLSNFSLLLLEVLNIVNGYLRCLWLCWSALVRVMLARVISGEAGVPLFSCSGSEFEEMIDGVGAQRVRSLCCCKKAFALYNLY
jgi:hypothetical protein